jgi:hypothetical protein
VIRVDELEVAESSAAEARAIPKIEKAKVITRIKPSFFKLTILLSQITAFIASNCNNSFLHNTTGGKDMPLSKRCGKLKPNLRHP